MSVCPSPKGDGMELTSFLCDGVMSFQVKDLFQDSTSFSPLGETGEGSNLSARVDEVRFRGIVSIKLEAGYTTPEI